MTDHRAFWCCPSCDTTWLGTDARCFCCGRIGLPALEVPDPTEPLELAELELTEL